MIGHLRQDAVSLVELRAAESAQLRRQQVQRLLSDVGPRIAGAVSSGNPGIVGQWSDVYAWPIVAIHAALLPDGKVLAYDSRYDAASESYADHTSTRYAIWDPAAEPEAPSGPYLETASNYNIFCSGLAHLPDGKVLIAGGNRDNYLNGLNVIHVFDPLTSSFTLDQTNTMNNDRWYPSVTPLADGTMLITSGIRPDTAEDIPEVRAEDGALSALTNAHTLLPLYPWLQVAPDGNVAYVGPTSTLRALSTSSTGQWTDFDHRDQVDRTYGSHALYDIGKVLVAGGGLSEASAVIVDLYSHTATATGAMQHGRRQHNLTILADGSVLATGGNSSGAELLDMANGVYAAESWNPATGQWTELASMQVTRQYHSSALLLPDGRVLSGGGGICGICTTDSYLAKNAEVFSPPYLYSADGTAAPRPTITSTPTMLPYDSAFTVITPEASRIRKAALIRLSSVTHSVNFEQRYVPLSLHRGSGALRLITPVNANIAPPGYYMLFVIDDQGVPSVAKFIRLKSDAAQQPDTPPSAVSPGTRTSPLAQPVNLTLNITDPDAGPLRFTATGLPAGVNLDADTGVLSGVPQVAGSYTVTVIATDDRDHTVETGFTWSIVASTKPKPPKILSPGNQTNRVGEATQLTIIAPEPNGEPVSFSASGLPPGLAIDANSGVIAGMPSLAGSYFVTIRASDNKDGTAKKNILWLITAATATATVDAGLVYEYYEGDWATVPLFANLVPVKTGIVKKPNLSLRERNDRYAFRFVGSIRIDAEADYTFYLNSDGASKLWIDNRLLVNNDGTHTRRERSGTRALSAGKHRLVVGFATSDNARFLNVKLAGHDLLKQNVPTDRLQQPSRGLSYEYYDGRWSSLPDLDRLQPAKRGFASLLDAAPFRSQANFALRFRARLKLPTRTDYTFYLQANTGASVWIDGRPLLSRTTSSTQEVSTTRWFTGGEHDLVVGYFSNRSPKTLGLWYSSSSMSKQPVRASAFPAD